MGDIHARGLADLYAAGRKRVHDLAAAAVERERLLQSTVHGPQSTAHSPESTVQNREATGAKHRD